MVSRTHAAEPWPGAHPPETLTALLESTAARAPDGIALIHDGHTITWREFLARTRRVAGGLARRGVAPGDRIALWMPTLPDYLVLCFAAWRIGAVIVSVNTRFQSSELAHVIGGQSPVLLAFTPGFAEIDFPAILARVPAAALATIRGVITQGAGAAGRSLLPEALADAEVMSLAALEDAAELTTDAATPDSPCVTFTTSGTTRAPKFVLHRHRGVALHARDVAAALGYDAPDSMTMQVTPLCAVYGFTQALAAIAAARPQVMMDRFEPRAAAALVRQHRVTHFNGTDDIFHRMLQVVPEEKPFPTLRSCGYALFNPALKGFLDEAERRGLPMIGLYGMSEVLALFSGQRMGDPAARRHRDGGFPVSPFARVRVRDPETDALLGHDQPGLLEIHAPSVMSHYDHNEEATREAFTGDGWLRTGDLACTIADGSFRYITRAGDALRLGGFLTSPAEIEAHMEAHPALRGVQVVGANTGARPCAVAFVLLRDGAAFDEAAMRAWCAEGLARYKVPERIVPLAEFPVTLSGNGTKIQRAVLRRMAQDLFDAPA